MAPKTDNQIILEAALREQVGKEKSGVLRRSGLIPAVVYGEGEKTLSVQVSAKALGKVLHSSAGENALITLRFEAGSTEAKQKKVPERVVLVKAVQHHPVTHYVIHVDFHHVSLTKEIKVTVPLVFKGEAIGVKQEGGILEHIRWDLEVECLPTQIPSEIAVEISHLALGVTMHASDITLPPGIQMITDAEQPIVACVTPKVEEEPEPTEEEAPEGAEPEVLKQKSPEEVAVEEAAAKEKKAEKGEKEKKSERGDKEKKG